MRSSIDVQDSDFCAQAVQYILGSFLVFELYFIP